MLHERIEVAIAVQQGKQVSTAELTGIPALARATIRAIHGVMADQRLIVAIGRAERALSRIDAAGTRAASWATDMVKKSDYDSLDRRHRKLRDAGAETLGALDRLIGVEPQG